MIIAISPLMNLTKDQTSFLRKFGISAGLIGEDKGLDLKIEKGECSRRRSLFLGTGVWRRFPGKTGPLYESIC